MILRLALMLLPAAAMPSVAAGTDADPATSLAGAACAAIAARVDRHGGNDPLLLASWESGEDAIEPALATAAFVYDNALAVIALCACGRTPAALRIGRALRAAALAPTRLRNVLRAGPAEAAPLPNGWWDAGAQRWNEDAQQMGTATGNVAWVGLALLRLHAEDADPRWIEAAARLGRWVIEETRGGDRGFSGGIDGFDAAPRRLGWKSTEHNVDLVALFAALAALDDDPRWPAARDRARRFVAAQWDAAAGHFVTGTLADGVTPNRDTSGLDAQLWPLLLGDADPDWRRVMAWVVRAHGVDAGFDFNADRDGIWIEGTAQAALVWRLLERPADARRALAVVARARSAGGWLYATREARVSTGLALGPDSREADFHYYRRPHLGATAWAVLAALGVNPFDPARSAAEPPRPLPVKP